MTRHSAAIIVSIVTALAGLSAALVNRVNPHEPAAEASYSITKDALQNLFDEIDGIDERITYLERLIMEQHAPNLDPAVENKPKEKPKKNKAKRRQFPKLEDVRQMDSP